MKADKVGVAAAVNPDAFSSLSQTPNKQLNIGKSIFYNERINTTASGLVQVLLVDGSTFTVGPNSDLVIDKFVYDPKTKSGQIVATFSKGAMRFIGGKISKNEGGVSVKTPAGSLAIRGGMMQMQVNGPKIVASFLYGVAMSLGNHTVFEPGYTIDTTTGDVTIRETTAADINAIMAALTNGNTNGIGSGTGDAGNQGTTGDYLQLATEADDIINEATATQIQAAIQAQIDKLNNQAPDPDDTTPGTTPPSTTPPGTTPQQTTAVFGYSGGVFTQTGGDFEAGTLSNLSPTEVVALFDGDTNTFEGAGVTLYVNDGAEGLGGVKATFVPVGSLSGNLPLDGTGAAFLGVAGHTIPNSITVFNDTHNGVLTSPATLNSGSAGLVGFTGAGQALCDSCSFLKWGGWAAVLHFQDNQRTVLNNNLVESENGGTNVIALGLWVGTGEIPTVGQLPMQGSASYDGRTLGTVAYNSGQNSWTTYGASGDVHMDWNFADRSGTLAINNFKDAGGQLPVLNLSGEMNMPGTLSKINSFSGPLSGNLGDYCQPITGSAVGSFAANGSDKAAAAIGNWNANNAIYKASGIFGASRTPINSIGSIGPR